MGVFLSFFFVLCKKSVYEIVLKEIGFNSAADISEFTGNIQRGRDILVEFNGDNVASW